MKRGSLKSLYRRNASARAGPGGRSSIVYVSGNASGAAQRGWPPYAPHAVGRLALRLRSAAAPEATIAVVGPVVKIDPSSLPRRANIAYLGKRGYDELPHLLAGFDVALMPFALNAHTANISPTKTSTSQPDFPS